MKLVCIILYPESVPDPPSLHPPLPPIPLACPMHALVCRVAPPYDGGHTTEATHSKQMPCSGNLKHTHWVLQVLQGGVWIYGGREYKYITQQFGLLQTHPCYFEPPHLHNNDRWPLRRSWTRTRTPGEGDPCGGPCAGDWVGYRGWVGDGGGVSKPKVRIVWIITLSCQDKDKNMEVMSGVWWLSAHINYPSVPFLKYFFFCKIRDMKCVFQLSF